VLGVDVLSDVFSGDGRFADGCRNSIVIASETTFRRETKQREVMLDKLDDSHPEEATQLAVVFWWSVTVDGPQQLLDPQSNNVEAKQRRIFRIHWTFSILAKRILK
jgi:hypothetical protein